MALPVSHYDFSLLLSSGATLRFIISEDEHRWIFEHKYRPRGEDGRIALVCDTHLTVDYNRGQLTDKMMLSMEIVILERLGKEFIYGVDVSPGAKTYVEFTYERDGDMFRLAEGQIGARPRQRFDGKEPGLTRIVDLPFPVPDTVKAQYGKFHVPFKHMDGILADFEFPTTIAK